MKEKIEQLLRAGFELKASDIHLTVGVPPVMRINGELKRYGKEVLIPEDTEGMAKAIIPRNCGESLRKKVNWIFPMVFQEFQDSVSMLIIKEAVFL